MIKNYIIFVIEKLFFSRNDYGIIIKNSSFFEKAENINFFSILGFFHPFFPIPCDCRVKAS
jgi:hypothetical protein